MGLTTNDEIAQFKRDANVRKIVSQYSSLNFMRQTGALFFNWILIVGVAYLSYRFFNPYIYALAVVVIGARQHALLVLMHEAAHVRVSKNLLLNDLLSDLFAAWPTLLSTGLYRKNHSAHHSFTNSERDPDWVRKQGQDEWVYPRKSSSILRMLGKFLVTGGADWAKLVWQVSKGDYKKIAYWGAVLASVVALGVFKAFMMYWLVPLFVVLPLIQRLRSISEHFALKYEHEFNGTRNVSASWVEQFLVSPHNVGYHLVHHLFPSVPFYNLKKVHAELLQFETYAKYAHTNDSYFLSGKSVWRDMIGESEKVSSKDIAA